MTNVQATLRLAEMAGMRIYGYELRSGSKPLRFITEADLNSAFRPWLSLDDCAELATALKGKGLIESWEAGSDADGNSWGYVMVKGRGGWLDTKANSPASGLLNALSLALLGTEPESGGREG